MSASDDIATAAARARRAGRATISSTRKTGSARASSAQVLDAVADGDDETARALVEPLHPADIADLIELAPADERADLIAALAGIVDADVYAELNEHVREDMIDEMEPQQVADLAAQLDTDDAVAIIEDLEEDEQRAVLRAMEPDDRAAVEEALTYPEETAGRLMQRDLIAVPEHWTVGQVIDYLRSSDELATDFWEVFVVSPDPPPGRHLQAVDHPALRPRGSASTSIMMRKQTLIPVDLDQEEVALRFQKYALISAAVVDPAGRLVGMITVDDIVHIIQEEAGEDALLLSGAGDGDINEPILDTYKDARALARRQPGDRAGRLGGDPLLRRLDRAAGGARGADADRRRGRRQCRHADAGGDRPRHRHQPADRLEPLARGRARDPRRADERADHRAC